MKSKYTFEKKSDHLQMKISGEFDESVFNSFPTIILTKCQELEMKKVLVDTLSVDYLKLSVLNRFFLGEELAEKTRGKLKIAIVVPSQYINKLLETVAINRGASVFVIDTVEDAKQWLTK